MYLADPCIAPSLVNALSTSLWVSVLLVLRLLWNVPMGDRGKAE
jgi:hypothetical protein